MRESMGATFLLKLMIIFIFFFASFLAIAINYSQAFRIKNQVINAIENYEGNNASSQEVIKSVINNSGYYRSIACTGNGSDGNGTGVIVEGSVINGICIKPVLNSDSTKVYFKVTTFVSFNIPIFGNVFNFPVIGETKVIKNY